MKSIRIHIILILIFATTHSWSQTHQLIITEIFADPTPSRGLPEKEFVEIKNATKEGIQIKGFKFIYGSTFSEFSSNILAPDERVIVCRAGNETAFESYGRVITLKNFSLSNEGNLLIIENPQKEYITSVNYSNSWYSKGREEGYSLEMIDESQACRGKENWASSVAAIGATPGGANSVGKILIDTELPFPVSQNINGSILQIYFNENIDNKDFNIGNFEIISGDFSIQKVVFDKFSTDFVEIFIDRVIEEGESLGLKLKILTDCIGNLNTDIILSFSNVPAPQQGEILISEILFNPAVGGEDFVEIKNITEKPLNLKNWKLAKRAKDGSVFGISLISSKDLIVKPTEYLAFSKNKTAVLSQYPESSVPNNIRELSSFPSLNNDQDLVLLLNENELVMDSVFYEEKMHNQQLNNLNGVSLERVNFNSNLSEKKNWQSAASDVGYATPGRKNSQEESEILSQDFWLENVVFNPYENAGNAVCKLNYQLPVQGAACNIAIIDRNGAIKKVLIKNGILGTSGMFNWDGTDHSGKLLPVGYYVFRIEVFSPEINKTYLVKTVLAAIK